jgi:hypothetical protein
MSPVQCDECRGGSNVTRSSHTHGDRHWWDQPAGVIRKPAELQIDEWNKLIGEFPNQSMELPASNKRI